MNVFLAFASPDRSTAESIQLALLGDEHEVFFDEANLNPGSDYNSRIREAIAESDANVFLISPDFAEAGRYVHTELRLTKEKWPKPWGFVLAVIIRPTSRKLIDPYLAATSFLEPHGDVAAEVAFFVNKLGKSQGSSIAMDQCAGRWSWMDNGIEFILDLYPDGTFMASSVEKVDWLKLDTFKGTWYVNRNRLNISQTHYRKLGWWWRFASVWAVWIDAFISTVSKDEINLENGKILKRVQTY